MIGLYSKERWLWTPEIMAQGELGDLCEDLEIRKDTSWNCQTQQRSRGTGKGKSTWIRCRNILGFERMQTSE